MATMLKIRQATEADAPALLAIYAPYIESTGADGVYEVVDEITPA